MSRFLIIGGSGALGRVLAGRFPDALLASRRKGEGDLFLDLADLSADWHPPSDVDVAFLCAAVTSQEACLKDPEGTRRINVEAPTVLARALVKGGARVVFPSTNLVFDGTTPHCPAHAPRSPRCEYGRQKAEAEAALLTLGDAVRVVRLTKVLFPNFPLFVRWRESLLAGEVVEPFADMVMAPLSPDLAVEALVRAGEAERGGVFQISAAEDVSYAAIAHHMAVRLSLLESLVRPVTGVPLEHKPAHTTLQCTDNLGMEAPEVWSIIDKAL